MLKFKLGFDNSDFYMTEFHNSNFKSDFVKVGFDKS